MNGTSLNSMAMNVWSLDGMAGPGGHVSPWVSVPLVFLLWVFFFSMVKRAVFAVVKKFTARTATLVDDVLFDAMDFPLQLMIYATGILVVHNFIPQGDAGAVKYLVGGFKVVAIFAVAMFIDRFLRGLVTAYAPRVDILRTSGGVVQGFIRVLIMGLGALIILDSLGISVTPIIASLGIGSLAVALALQPTLENFFSGIQLVADKSIQVGQLIRLDSGEEGTVTKIGWRSTWLCQPNNNTVIIPNKIVGNARIVNYDYPNAEIAVVVGVGVDYGADLDKVERVTLEEARRAQKNVEGAVRSAEPALRYDAFGDYSIHLNVVLRARDFGSVGLLKHAFIKQLHQRYAEEGIAIPYPTRTVINTSKAS